MINSMTHYASDVDNLLTILEEYKEEKDVLSIRIFRWSAKLFRDIEGLTDPEMITQVALERLKELVTQILINPIDGAPLHKPVVERFWWWEKWMHREYRKLFGVSPFDNERMAEKPPPHRFAKEMLRWAKNLAQLVPCRELATVQLNEEQMVALANYPQSEGQRRWLFRQIGQAALRQEQTRQIREDLEWGIIEVDAKVDKLQALSHQVMEGERNALQTEQQIQQQIDTVERLHREALAVVQQQMQWREKIHQEQVASLEKHIASLVQADASVVAEYKKQVGDLVDDYFKAVKSFESKIETIEKVCAAAVASAETQLISVRKDHHTALTTIASLGDQMTQINKNLLLANEELRAAHLNGQAQQAEIARLIASNQYALGVVDRLRKKKGGLPCVIS